MPKMTFFDHLNLPKFDFMYNLSGRQIVKFQHRYALTSHFESIWSIVPWAPWIALDPKFYSPHDRTSVQWTFTLRVPYWELNTRETLPPCEYEFLITPEKNSEKVWGENRFDYIPLKFGYFLVSNACDAHHSPRKLFHIKLNSHNKEIV